LALEPISPELVRIALDRVEGFPFERFVNDFYPAIVGRVFVPLGGVKDKGADAYLATVHEDARGTSSFYQVSVGVELEEKIRKTVERLREVGRNPRTLTYVTSRAVKYTDTVEESLTDELDVTVRIRDAGYIVSHINDGDQTKAAFNHHLRYLTDYLKSVGASTLIGKSRYTKDPTVYVFLAQELERRGGDQSLVSSMIDSLILWSLEDTDPDQGKFLTEHEVIERILSVLPSIEHIVVPRIRKRIRKLAAKDNPAGRQVRWHKADDLFCLPYETRRHIQAENGADEDLKISVLQSIEDRVLSQRREGLGEVGVREATELSLRALQKTFEREGLEFAAYLNRADSEEHATILDSINAALDERGHAGKRRLLLAETCFDAVRGVLYSSTGPEREYLHKLSRTYTLLFTLNTEPRLIQYFQEVAGDFHLYVGADQIVRALSEHYLAPADQSVRNTLLIAARAGARLVLTQPALEEVVWNLRTSDYEFENTFKSVERNVTYELARNSPKILVRAYLYATLNDELGTRKPANWPSFVNQFCDYPDLHRPGAFEAIRRYLQGTFSMHYQSSDDLAELVDHAALESLTERLTEFKSTAQLAHNDALLALAVYGQRRRARETAKTSEFGYKTWWLTDESKILRHTDDLVKEHDTRYILRPAFLLNFLTLAPAANEAREAFASVFPSLLGMTLSRRMPEATFKKVMQKVAVADSLDDARRSAAMARLVDQLKGDFEKQYLN
jgi:hypothetical protein